MMEFIRLEETSEAIESRLPAVTMEMTAEGQDWVRKALGSRELLGQVLARKRLEDWHFPFCGWLLCGAAGEALGSSTGQVP